METRQKTVEEMELELSHFRQSMNEWVMFLNQCNMEMNERIMALEKRIAKMELDNHLRL